MVAGYLCRSCSHVSRMACRAARALAELLISITRKGEEEDDEQQAEAGPGDWWARRWWVEEEAHSNSPGPSTGTGLEEEEEPLLPAGGMARIGVEEKRGARLRRKEAVWRSEGEKAGGQDGAAGCLPCAGGLSSPESSGDQPSSYGPCSLTTTLTGDDDKATTREAESTIHTTRRCGPAHSCCQGGQGHQQDRQMR